MPAKYAARGKITALTAAGLVFILTAPYLRAQDRRSFNFAVMGCAHMGVCESKDYALAAAKIKAQRPDFVVFLGGMVDIPREGDVESVWREFDSITAKLGVPVYNVPGSCSWGPLIVERGKIDRAEKCFSDRYKKRYYSFEHKNNLFICLDSDSPSRSDRSGNGAISAEQLDFLKKTVGGALKFDNIFLFLHDSRWMRENLAKRLADAYPLLLKKMRYVFAAKEHFVNAENIDGLSYITTGSPPCSLKHATRPVLFHFLDVEVSGAKTFINVVPLKSIPLENLITAGKGRKAKRNYPVIKPALMDSIERKNMLPIEPIIAALNIKPGMQLADVGAGVGVFTFPFAAALNGTGMVFATDTDPDMIKSLRRTAAEEGYKNILPVSVAAEGVDPFYKGRTFDIMFFAELYHYLRSPVDYFRELKPSLARETGRLYIIHFKNVPDFGEIEFDDFTNTLKTLKILKLEANSTVFSKAGAGIGDFLNGRRGNEVPPAVRKRIVGNFNALLADPELFDDLTNSPGRYDYIESPERGTRLLKKIFSHDLNLARWLLTELESRGVFEKKAEQLTGEEKKYLKALNRILLTGVFKMDKLDFLKGVYPLYAEKERIISDMEAAGYRFVREHDFPTYHHFLEFK